MYTVKPFLFVSTLFSVCQQVCWFVTIAYIFQLWLIIVS